MKKEILLMLSLLFLIFSGFAQNTSEVYIHFSYKEKSELKQISQAVKIRNVVGNEVFAYANENDLQKLKSLGVSYQIIPCEEKNKKKQDVPNLAQINKWHKYPTYTEYETMMQQFATNYPQICKLVSIGKTILGRDIYFLKISDNVNEKEAEPEVMYSSTMHGNELTGYVLMLRLIDYILTNYETNTQIKNLVNSAEIWINPNANPDGTYLSDNQTVEFRQRGNAADIDLNRNFPDAVYGAHADGEEWQKETLAMMNFMGEHNFALSANFHTGAELINYPWDVWTTGAPDYNPHPDNNWFKQICKNYVDTLRKYSENLPGYFTWPYTNGYTEGADWYYLYGGRQDYMNYYKHGREVTIELSNAFTPDTSTLSSYWNANRNSLINYMEESLYGIRGIVTDASSGEPIRAKIEIINHDKDSSEIYSDPANGNYHRLIFPGVYALKYSASGYESKIIYNVSVTNKQATIENVALQQKNVNNDSSVWEQFCLKTNPFKDNLLIEIHSAQNINSSIRILDFLGRMIYSQEQMLNAGVNGIIINTTSLQKGLYFINLKTSSSAKTVIGIKQ